MIARGGPYADEGRCAVGANDLDFSHRPGPLSTLCVPPTVSVVVFLPLACFRSEIVGVLLINTLPERGRLYGCSLFPTPSLIFPKYSRNRFGMLGGISGRSLTASFWHLHAASVFCPRRLLSGSNSLGDSACQSLNLAGTVTLLSIN